MGMAYLSYTSWLVISTSEILMVFTESMIEKSIDYLMIVTPVHFLGENLGLDPHRFHGWLLKYL